MKKKFLILFLFLLIISAGCYTHLQTPPPRQGSSHRSEMPKQKMIAKIDTTNYIRFGEIDNYAYLDFIPRETNPHPNVKRIMMDETAAISPNRELAVVLQKEFGIATVYNKNGDILGKYNTATLTDVVIADDGRFVVYGVNVTESKGTSYLKCYTADGMEMGINEKFGKYTIGDFSPSGELFVFIAATGYDDLVTVKIFDVDFYEIGEHVFEDWSYRSELFLPQFNKKEDTITIQRFIPKENGSNTRETITLNKYGDILELRGGGW